MKILACYDNGGKTFDRYTIVFDETEKYHASGNVFNACLAIGNDPRGFSQWSTCQMGRHLGKKLKFEELPENVQKHVIARIACDDENGAIGF